MVKLSRLLHGKTHNKQQSSKGKDEIGDLRKNWKKKTQHLSGKEGTPIAPQRDGSVRYGNPYHSTKRDPAKSKSHHRNQVWKEVKRDATKAAKFGKKVVHKADDGLQKANKLVQIGQKINAATINDPRYAAFAKGTDKVSKGTHRGRKLVDDSSRLISSARKAGGRHRTMKERHGYVKEVIQGAPKLVKEGRTLYRDGRQAYGEGMSQVRSGGRADPPRSSAQMGQSITRAKNPSAPSIPHKMGMVPLPSESSSNNKSTSSYSNKYGDAEEHITQLLRASYEPTDEERIRLLAQANFDYRPDLSEKKIVVGVHKETGQPIVLFRGSQDYQDWALTDRKIMQGYKADELPRVRKARAIVKKVEQETGRSDVMAAGHSLGGYLAQHSGASGGTITFNKYSVGEDPKHRENQRDFRTTGDTASFLRDRTSGIETFEMTGSKPWQIKKNHSKFTPLKEFVKVDPAVSSLADFVNQREQEKEFPPPLKKEEEEQRKES